MILDTNFSLEDKKMAAISLKNAIDTNWSSKTEKFNGVEVSEKVLMKTILFCYLL